MRFALYDHAGKGHYLRQRLIEAGHTPVERIEDTDVLLLDCDWAWAHPRPVMIEAAHKAGAKIVVYPHGGMPTVFVYDGLTEPNACVDARLEHGPGSVAIAGIFGQDARLAQHAPGWLFSPTAPFTPRETPGRVLFAPMHPNIEALQNGTNGHDPAPALNQRVYRELLAMGADITVSLVGPPNRSGVWQHPRATFVSNPAMSFTASYQLVAAADSVVAAGTLGALGVALGKPTVMLGQGDFSDYVGGEYVHAEHEALYCEMARYPLDAEDGDLAALLACACGGDVRVAEWRQQFVGDDGTEAAVRLIENIVGTMLSEQAKYAGHQGGVMTEEPEEPQGDDEGDEPTEEAESKNVSIEGVTATLGAVA